VVLVNDHLWFLSVLMVCTALFWVCARMKAKYFGYAYLGLIVLGILLCGGDPVGGARFARWGRGLYAVFTGVLLQRVMRKKRLKLEWAIGILVIVLGISALLYRYVSGVMYLILVFAVYPLLILIFSDRKVGSYCKASWIRTLSDSTYGVYLWHYPLFEVFGNMLEGAGIQMKALRMLGLFTMFVFLVGVLSRRYIGIPMGEWIRKKIEILKEKRED